MERSMLGMYGDISKRTLVRLLVKEIAMLFQIGSLNHLLPNGQNKRAPDDVSVDALLLVYY